MGVLRVYLSHSEKGQHAFPGATKRIPSVSAKYKGSTRNIHRREIILDGSQALSIRCLFNTVRTIDAEALCIYVYDSSEYNPLSAFHAQGQPFTSRIHLPFLEKLSVAGSCEHEQSKEPFDINTNQRCPNG